MDKRDFLVLLRDRISALPQSDIDERLNFYSEMIDDYMEEGLSETEAVSRIGSVNEIAAQIIADASLPTPAQADSKPSNKRNPWKIALIIIGSPIWFSLIVACLAVAIALYASLCAVVIALWAVFAALCGSAIGCIFGGVGIIIQGYPEAGIALIGAALVLAGLSIFMRYACTAATKGFALLTKKIFVAIKNRIHKKEEAK